MGYDCTMYLVSKSNSIYDGDKKRYAQVIAKFEMYKMDYNGAYHKLFTSKSKKPTDCYIYIGEEETVKDCYGEPLTEASIADTIAALESDNAKDPYRRIPPVVAYLKTFDLSDWTNENIVVLHYGH